MFNAIVTWQPSKRHARRTAEYVVQKRTREAARKLAIELHNLDEGDRIYRRRRSPAETEGRRRASSRTRGIREAGLMDAQIILALAAERTVLAVDSDVYSMIRDRVRALSELDLCYFAARDIPFASVLARKEISRRHS